MGNRHPRVQDVVFWGDHKDLIQAPRPRSDLGDLLSIHCSQLGSTEVRPLAQQTSFGPQLLSGTFLSPPLVSWLGSMPWS